MSTTANIYKSKIFIIANTMVVKHQYIAKIINESLTLQGYEVDPHDPSSWKYYLNLAGEYHQYDKDQLSILSAGVTDQLMINIAGDTSPVSTPFTKELLNGPLADPAMINEYKYGSQYYNELVAKYPQFQELILGILYPVELDISIPAKDGEILVIGGYTKTKNDLYIDRYYFKRTTETIFNQDKLIEDNELSIIYKLQDFINGFLLRWFNPDFTKVDDLYFQTLWGQLFSCIPVTIMNLRWGSVKTSEASEYHVKEYLNSHGYLGQYVDNLNPAVYMWLYRNVEWLEANIGKRLIFDAIIENVLTPSYIPISAYLLEHNNSRLLDDVVPSIQGFEYKLNFNELRTLTQRPYTIRELLDKEVGMARDNDYDLDEDDRKITFHGNRSRHSRFDTKLLESRVLDLSNFIPYQIEDVLINMWAYSIAKGTYRGITYVTHPKTGDRIQITQLNAFILMVYCFNKGYNNVTLDKIPNVNVSMIPREISHQAHPDYSLRPDFSQLRKLAPNEYLPDSDIDVIIGSYVPQFNFINSTDFYQSSEVVWSELNRHYHYHDSCQTIHRSAYRDIVSRRLYWYDMPMDLPSTGQDYSSWLALLNLNLDDLSQRDHINLMVELFTYGTGFKENANKKLVNVQKACIAILKHFSSYTVQYVRNLSNYAPLHSRDQSLKIDELEFYSESKYSVDVGNSDISIDFHHSVGVMFPIPDTLSSEHVEFSSYTMMPYLYDGIKLELGSSIGQTLHLAVESPPLVVIVDGT